MHLSEQMAELLRHVHHIAKEIKRMATSIENLTAQVAKNTTVIGSAIDLIKGIKKRLDDAISTGNPAALDKLSADLGSSDQALAEAISANTPVDPANPGPFPGQFPNNPATGGPFPTGNLAPFPVNPATGISFVGTDINPATGQRFDAGFPNPGFPNAQFPGFAGVPFPAGVVPPGTINPTTGMPFVTNPATGFLAGDVATREAERASARKLGNVSFTWTDAAGVKRTENV